VIVARGIVPAMATVVVSGRIIRAVATLCTGTDAIIQPVVCAPRPVVRAVRRIEARVCRCGRVVGWPLSGARHSGAGYRECDGRSADGETSASLTT
jgi:hypothetical protein